MNTCSQVLLNLSQKNLTSRQPAMAWTCLGKLWPFFHKEEAQSKSHDGAIKINTDNEWW